MMLSITTLLPPSKKFLVVNTTSNTCLLHNLKHVEKLNYIILKKKMRINLWGIVISYALHNKIYRQLSGLHLSFIAYEFLISYCFNIGRHGNIPSRSTILRWVTSFRARWTIIKKKPPGPVATARNPENVERVRGHREESNPLFGDMLSNWEWAKAR